MFGFICSGREHALPFLKCLFQLRKLNFAERGNIFWSRGFQISSRIGFRSSGTQFKACYRIYLLTLFIHFYPALKCKTFPTWKQRDKNVMQLWNNDQKEPYKMAELKIIIINDEKPEVFFFNVLCCHLKKKATTGGTHLGRAFSKWGCRNQEDPQFRHWGQPLKWESTSVLNDLGVKG